MKRDGCPRARRTLSRRKGCHVGVERRDHGLAILHREAAARQKVALDVDDQQCIMLGETEAFTECDRPACRAAAVSWHTHHPGGNCARTLSTASWMAASDRSMSASVNSFFAQPCQTGLWLRASNTSMESVPSRYWRTSTCGPQ